MNTDTRPVGRPRIEDEERSTDDKYFELFDPVQHKSLGNGGYMRRPLPAHE